MFVGVCVCVCVCVCVGQCTIMCMMVCSMGTVCSVVIVCSQLILYSNLCNSTWSTYVRIHYTVCVHCSKQRPSERHTASKLDRDHEQSGTEHDTHWGVLHLQSDHPRPKAEDCYEGDDVRYEWGPPGPCVWLLEC